MQFTDRDRSSETWTKLMAHLNELLIAANRKNENNLTIEETANIRGRIKLIRELLKLSAPAGTESE